MKKNKENKWFNVLKIICLVFICCLCSIFTVACSSIADNSSKSSANTYSVTFVGGMEATGTAPTMESKAAGVMFVLPENTFERTGYNFSGWDDGEKVYKELTTYTMPESNVTFTATWVKSKAVATVTQLPIASTIEYGDALKKSTLSEGKANVEGAFSWVDDSLKPTHTGVYVAAVEFIPNDNVNYQPVEFQVNVQVNARKLTVSTFSKWTKEYDSTTNYTDFVPMNIVGEDDVIIIANYVSASVAEEVVINFALSGEDMDNYIVPDAVTGSITPKLVSVIWPEKEFFVYNGEEIALIVSLEGVAMGDEVSLDCENIFATEIGNYKATVKGLKGEDAENYRVVTESFEYTVAKGISKASDFLALDGATGGTYIQTANIDMTTVANFSGLTSFSGVYDGNGFTLKVKLSKDNTATFGTLSGGIVKNVWFDIIVTGANCAGVSYSDGSIIDCYVGIMFNGVTTGCGVMWVSSNGLVEHTIVDITGTTGATVYDVSLGGTIKDCYIYADMTPIRLWNPDTPYGNGNTWIITKNGSYLIGMAYQTEFIYKNRGDFLSAVLANIGEYAIAFAEKFEDLANKKTKINFAKGENAATGTMEQVEIGVGQEYTIPECAYKLAGGVFVGWSNGSIIYTVGEKVQFGNDVTLTAVWSKTIQTAEDFAALNGATGGSYIQTADIDMTSIAGFSGLTSFAGTYDGNGYELKVSLTNANSATFGTLEGTVKNVWLDVTITAQNCAGICFQHGNIFDSYINVMFTGKGTGSGVMLYMTDGYVKNTIVNITGNAMAAVTGASYGGVIENCYVYAGGTKLGLASVGLGGNWNTWLIETGFANRLISSNIDVYNYIFVYTDKEAFNFAVKANISSWCSGIQTKLAILG